MTQTFLRISEEINTYIKITQQQYQHDDNQAAELSIQFIAIKLQEVKEKFETENLISPEDEIFYFKHIKCHLLALIHYYSLMLQIDFDKPATEKGKLKKYYVQKHAAVLRKLKKYQHYYRYFKTNAVFMDGLYFRKTNQDQFIIVGDFLLDIDSRIHSSTLHIFAMIEASDMLRDYLKQKIKSFSSASVGSTQQIPNTQLQWTTSKTDLIELIYALHATGAFNNGKADLKDIAEYCQHAFGVNLGQYNRVFFDIRGRKANKTKFLDSLKEALIKRMKDTDNELFA